MFGRYAHRCGRASVDTVGVLSNFLRQSSSSRMTLKRLRVLRFKLARLDVGASFRAFHLRLQLLRHDWSLSTRTLRMNSAVTYCFNCIAHRRKKARTDPGCMGVQVVIVSRGHGQLIGGGDALYFL